jgi:CRP-like cAMP-binding protein
MSSAGDETVRMTDAEDDVTVQPAPANTKTRPVLTPALMARLRAYGLPEKVGAGDLIYQLGDESYDLILIESGRVDLLSEPATGQGPSLIAEMGPGDFLGEISLFTGERMFITACVREPTAIYRIGAEAFRQLMAQDAELSDLILTALYHRRDLLKTALAGTIEILGQQNSAAALALVAYAERMELPHKWTDADRRRGTSLGSSLELEPADLPTVLLPDAVLVNAHRHSWPDTWRCPPPRSPRRPPTSWWSAADPRVWRRRFTAPPKVCRRPCWTLSPQGARPPQAHGSRTIRGSPTDSAAPTSFVALKSRR